MIFLLKKIRYYTNASNFYDDINMLDNLEIHHLKTLEALYYYKSVTNAAEKLNISQQAISLKLNKMRNIFGDQLFLRQDNSLVPTEYTHKILPYVTNVLESIHNIPLPSTLNLYEIKRTLVISATDYAQKVLIAPLLRKLAKEAPNVQLIVCNIEVASLVKKMAIGEIDLAITSYGYVPEGLLVTPIHTESYRCLSGNTSISNTQPMSLKELIEFDFIVTNLGTSNLKGSADYWFEKQNLSRKIVMSAPSFDMTKAFLKNTNMVAFVPSRLLPCDGLNEIILEKYPPGYEVVATYHPRSKDDILINWVLKAMAKHSN